MKKRIFLTAAIAAIIAVFTMSSALASDSEAALLAGIDPEVEQAYREYSQTAYEMGKFVTVSLGVFIEDYDEMLYSTVEEYLTARIAALDAAQDIAEVAQLHDEMRKSGIQSWQDKSKLPMMMILILFTAK